MHAFYLSRTYDFAWFTSKGPTAPAASLYEHILDMKSEGLPGEIPYKAELLSLIEAPPSLAAELMLTAQYYRYAQKTWTGIDPSEAQKLNWHLPRHTIAYTPWLDSLIKGYNNLDSAPVYRQYALLKQYLVKYEAIQDAHGLPILKSDKRGYKKGDSSAFLAAIRTWFFLTGDLSADTHSPIFDNDLEKAVLQFQQRSGLKTDSILTADVIYQMNRPLSYRIRQIIVNMERSRWIPVNLYPDYEVVNIPEYALHVYEQNNLVWSMNIVVGKADHPTAIFSGNIHYVVFSPYWNVPNSILRNEVLPGIRRNSHYLADHNMEWHEGGVRQKPGPDNSLGLVKFLFPNSYNIYLHDTPAKSLFGETKRAFSHGCIRLEDAQKFANYLLRQDTAWPAAKISEAMHSGKEQTVTLKSDHPVFIVYFTAWVDRQGRLNFRPDTYGRDIRLSALVSK
jgi:murein L,D-transpeptidase YcbB/YkuD